MRVTDPKGGLLMWFNDRLDEFLLKSETRWRLPFTALAKTLRKLRKSTGTILDVGCGKGFPARLLNRKGSFRIVGIDVFMPYLVEAKSCGAYQDLVLADLRGGLPFKDKSFDVVICIGVIEHLEKEKGSRLLRELERVAREKVIIITPVGFAQHPLEDGNPFSVHCSGWHAHELKSRGYMVRGTALRVGNPRNCLLRVLYYSLGVLFAPLAHFRPDLSFGMMAEKKLTCKTKCATHEE